MNANVEKVIADLENKAKNCEKRAEEYKAQAADLRQLNLKPVGAK
jgi:hypothetical protein